MVIASCSSTEDAGPEADSDSTSEKGSATNFSVRVPDEIVRPTSEGAGIVYPQPAAPAPEGYVEEEFFIGGTASSFEAVDTPNDGMWTAAPGDEADYRTRVIVRRPTAEEDFSGTVLLEWLNVSAIEAAPDWAYMSEEMGREGHAYIAVSAQSQGVEGGDTILSVEVDPDASAEADVEPPADASGLKNIDPDRYGTLTHPGDEYAYDIFSQVGQAVTDAPGELLGGFEPEQVLALGESQSAFFLSTLANAVHPLDPVFDGFLIHSRGAGSAPLDGAALGSDDDGVVDEGVLIRTDLDVPVFIVEAETDLTLLGYASARQPDTDRIRTWEIAGTAHADAHQFRSILGGPRDASVGSLIGCTEPINTGPHHEVVQAALSHLVGWAAGGAAPPAGEPLGLENGEEVVIARDDLGIALGGVRNPLVDVPVVVATGDPPGGGSLADFDDGGGICLLFGGTTPIDQPTLVELHGSADAYLEAFKASAAEAVDAGFLLEYDADQLVAEAEANASLFG
jgi:hypothetical protein